MTKKEKVKIHIVELFNKLKEFGFLGINGSYKTYSIKTRWIDGVFERGEYRVIDQEYSIRFEKRFGKKWVNLCKKTNYKKDFPIIPECYLN